MACRGDFRYVILILIKQLYVFLKLDKEYVEHLFDQTMI